MSRPVEPPPRWATDETNNAEPSEGTKDTGWANGDVVVSSYFNWFMLTVYQWLTYFADSIGGARVRHIPPVMGQSIVGGVFDETRGNFGFTGGTQKLVLPIVLEEGEVLKRIDASILTVAGGTNAVTMTLYQVDCTGTTGASPTAIDDATTTTNDDTTEVISITGLNEISADDLIHYILTFSISGYDVGAVVDTISVTTQLAGD